jgi:hypothetical protein
VHGHEARLPATNESEVNPFKNHSLPHVGFLEIMTACGRPGSPKGRHRRPRDDEMAIKSHGGSPE